MCPLAYHETATTTNAGYHGYDCWCGRNPHEEEEAHDLMYTVCREASEDIADPYQLTEVQVWRTQGLDASMVWPGLDYGRFSVDNHCKVTLQDGGAANRKRTTVLECPPNDPRKFPLCHKEGGGEGWSLTEVAFPAMLAHLAQHPQDFIPGTMVNGTLFGCDCLPHVPSPTPTPTRMSQLWTSTEIPPTPMSTLIRLMMILTTT